MKSNQSIFFFLISFLVTFSVVLGQIPQVPSTLRFADLTIHISPQAMREIQLDVDAQYRNPAYFKIKQDRVNLYMPIIERVLAENDVPQDLKYLVIQESALISDAVSTSNAVGFWQFKKATAEEVFLRVDNQIDERKNIASSTRGAALYLKKHNKTFDNWMAALVSYQMGLGGAKSYFGTSQHGKKIIAVEKDTYWYFKKFLAHKIAFEGQSTYLASNKRLAEILVKGPTHLSEIARQYGISENHVFEYNKWTKNGEIPSDKTYSVIFVAEGNLDLESSMQNQTVPKRAVERKVNSTTSGNSAISTVNEILIHPKITGNTSRSSIKNQILVNGLKGVLARQTTSVSKFTKEIKFREKRFKKVNDLGDDDPIIAGAYYYTEKKNISAEIPTHIVRSGETLWSISQRYGILLSSLKSKNRIRKDSDLKEGMILHLQEPRKRGTKIQIKSPKMHLEAMPQATEQRGRPETNKEVKAAPPAETQRVSPEPNKEVKASPTHAAKNVPETNPESLKSFNDTHTVVQGETLFAISKKYGVTVEQLKSWNRIGRENIISIGQKLVIFRP